MRRSLPSTVLAALAASAALALSGCAPGAMGTPGVTAPAVAPVPQPAADTDYLSRSDNGFTIPAVPLEKVPPALLRQVVDYPTDQAPGTVIVSPGQKFLYYVAGNNKAIRYGISVGKAGFEWAGEAQVAQTKVWPTWTPPKEMIERTPKLAKWEDGQPGGPTNPLGARAIYLTSNGRDYGYRIHGTPDWWSIGKNASSGCIRMIQQDVIDLNSRILPGAKVIVLNADGSVPTKLKVPPPAKTKPKVSQPKPVPAVVDSALPTPETSTTPLGEDSATPVADPTPATPAPTIPPDDATTPSAAPVPAAPVIDTMPVAPAEPTAPENVAPLLITPAPATTTP